MKLKIIQAEKNKHTDTVPCLGWTSNSELFTFGDDRKVYRWTSDGDLLGSTPMALFDSPTHPGTKQPTTSSEPASLLYLTDIHWFPVTSGKSSSVAELFAAGGTDGKFYLCTKGNKIDKVAEAHKGAVLAVRWNSDGSALVTAGEDGQIKIFSPSGMLRSVLVQSGYPVYSVAWAPANDQILYTNGRNLIVKSLQPANKPVQWKAHDGVILKVDWSTINNTIISGGEDRKYKVWDMFGRQLFSSAPFDHPVTSLSWSPSGELFAVGSYNTLRICDKLGWSHTLTKPNSGSILCISWTPDGTQIACGGGSGAVIFGNVIDRQLDWKNYEFVISDDHKIIVNDVLNGTKEELEFRDRVINASIGFSYLIVATSSQCYVYSDKNWNTPTIVDLSNNGRVTCIKQCPNYFAIVDNFTGIQVYTYEARLVCSPKYPGLRAESLNSQSIAISNDVVAIKDRADEKNIHLFDITSGRTLGGGPLKHHTEVCEMSMSQSNSSSVGRQLVIVDKNRDMYFGTIAKLSLKKLATMVEAFSWNDDTDMLAAMVDGQFVVWYYPNVVFVDEDIEPITRIKKEGVVLGKGAQFVNFSGTICTLRKADGALVTVSNISPLPAMLQEQAKKKQWEEAVRLCRHAKLPEMWACLAAIAVHGQDLNTAEVAYANIDEAAKVQYICRIREIPTPEGRSAQLALLRRQTREAETILISANLIYRAIQMWIDLYNWDRALDIAVKYKTHVDTVLYFRERYLKTMCRKEANKKFLQYSQGVTVDWDKIQSKIHLEIENEKNRKNAKPYQ